MSLCQPTVPAEHLEVKAPAARRSAVYARTVQARIPETVRELVWLHADLRMADVPEDATLRWTGIGVEARWEVNTSDARPV